MKFHRTRGVYGKEKCLLKVVHKIASINNIEVPQKQNLGELKNSEPRSGLATELILVAYIKCKQGMGLVLPILSKCLRSKFDQCVLIYNRILSSVQQIKESLTITVVR